MFPCSCLLFNMCKAQAKTGLFVFMYLVCSLCLTLNDLPVCPTYELLQVLHFSVYIPRGIVEYTDLRSTKKKNTHKYTVWTERRVS